tara:strand:+ start:170 stop:370 length:201 start_codon:yes stop_codon:yes gene_type:complete
MKKKNSITKHDIRRRLKSNEIAMLSMVDRISTIEKVFNHFIEMENLENKFKKFLDGKYKQSEHKQS